MAYTLYFGNMNYSSWSLRAWLLMTHFGIPFEARQVQVSGIGPNDSHRAYSPNGLVPCLHVDGFPVWETLAIAETLAERHPGLWPADALARARARSVSAEMHAGFGALRGAMPMNIKLRLQGAPLAPEVQADVDRVVQIWCECRAQFGAGDDGLFGGFSIADAMFAPVVWRFHTYNVPLPPAAAAYRDAMLALPAMRAWEAGALAETVSLAECDALAGRWGGVR
ncbi:glutathione S-transferase family protein [Nitrogeniibacter mangrovi]|uniref:Glutathione S-transferase family protein n=1 Tax=Nitrogeniibacter mangrovi TaxID=2016596 RepID=A0A6C1B6K6_9RHOO|nr:glutathione S-transferase family protein [Nitrogeniibacter mangrovi]QID19331.1 glutathione S-transferase family protein [Nitrogeniibacter mangrovi]